ncbi:hypothetical protein GJ496_007726 [Pomphorhynchus laevis]|nr:hypothetical protein GJ496_007726 [Pomphorhynchus laevis]
MLKIRILGVAKASEGMFDVDTLKTRFGLIANLQDETENEQLRLHVLLDGMTLFTYMEMDGDRKNHTSLRTAFG